MKAVRPVIGSNGTQYLKMTSEVLLSTSKRENEGKKKGVGIRGMRREEGRKGCGKVHRNIAEISDSYSNVSLILKMLY